MPMGGLQDFDGSYVVLEPAAPKLQSMAIVSMRDPLGEVFLEQIMHVRKGRILLSDLDGWKLSEKSQSLVHGMFQQFL